MHLFNTLAFTHAYKSERVASTGRSLNLRELIDAIYIGEVQVESFTFTPY